MADQLTERLTVRNQNDLDHELSKKIVRTFEVSPNAKVILLNENLHTIVIAEYQNGQLLPLVEDYADRMLTISQIDDPLLQESFQKYKKNESKKERVLFKRKFDHFNFWHKYRKYTAIYKQIELGPQNVSHTIAIVYPYRDFFSSFTRNNIILYSLAAFFVLLAIWSAMQLSQRISQPLSVLAQATARIKFFDLESPVRVHSRLIEVGQMSDAIENMRTGLRSFKKYVPADLVRQLIAMKKEAALDVEKKYLTIFFSDIAGFTTISEQMAPEALVELLSEYLGGVTETLIEYKATVDKYIGDAVMAFWGAPNEFHDHASQACYSALAFQKKLAAMNVRWEKQGKVKFSSRIGINTGQVVVGNLGYDKRMNYTVIGDAVNLAARIEGLNKSYGTSVLIGQETKQGVSDLFELRLIDRVVVKGKQQGIELYELIASKGEGDPQRLQARDLYEEGLALYFKRDFSKARQAFAEASEIYTNNQACQIFITRCDSFIVQPPADDWNGAFVAISK